MPLTLRADSNSKMVFQNEVLPCILFLAQMYYLSTLHVVFNFYIQNYSKFHVIGATKSGNFPHCP
jgi:hypothetical protein